MFAAAAELLLRTTQHEFPIIDGGNRLRGIVTREDIVTALRTEGDAASIMTIMTTDVPTVHQNTSLAAIFERMQREVPVSSACSTR